MIDEPLPVGAALAGIEDAIKLVRKAGDEVGDDRRSQTLTRRKLEEALDVSTLVGGEAPAGPRRGLPAWTSSRRMSEHCPTLPQR